MAEAELSVDFVGADRVIRRFEDAAEKVHGETVEAIDSLGQDTELIFAAHALRRSGRLARGVVARTEGLKGTVTATAKNPQTGFDYVAVTRFGHRVSRIYPKRAKALRFVIGGRVVFARSVRGFKPATDWRDDALPQINAQADAIATRLGRRIEAL